MAGTPLHFLKKTDFCICNINSLILCETNRYRISADFGNGRRGGKGVSATFKIFSGVQHRFHSATSCSSGLLLTREIYLQLLHIGSPRLAASISLSDSALASSVGGANRVRIPPNTRGRMFAWVSIIYSDLIARECCIILSGLACPYLGDSLIWPLSSIQPI